MVEWCVILKVMAVDVKKFERILKALANRRRLAILQYLKRQEEGSVGDVADAINLSLKATSKHLGILAAADIVEREQKSLQMFYRLALDQIAPVKYIISLL